MKASGKSSRPKGLLELERAVKKQRSSNGARPAQSALALAARTARPLTARPLKAPKRKRQRGIQALLAQTKAPERRRVESRAYDVGAPIRTSLELAAPAWTSVVEAFELAGEARRAPWPWPAAEDESTNATTAFTVEAFEAEPEETAYPAPSEPESAAVAVPAVELPDPERTPAPDALAAALATETDEESAEFARQIQALLAGVAPQPAPAKVPEVKPEPPAPAPPVANAHDVFSRMGRNMSYATEFRLPAMELGKRFDAIEHEIERGEARQAARYEDEERAFELTDEEIREGLRLPPAPAPAPAPAAPVPAPAPAPVLAAPPEPPLRAEAPPISATADQAVQNGSPPA